RRGRASAPLRWASGGRPPAPQRGPVDAACGRPVSRRRLGGRAVGGLSARPCKVADAGSAVFPPDPAKWLTLANGLLVATLGCAGLVAHELCSERVVPFLQ